MAVGAAAEKAVYGDDDFGYVGDGSDIRISCKKSEIARPYVVDAMKDISNYVNQLLELNISKESCKSTSLKDPPHLRPKGLSNARLKDQ
ncbi:hypothetical protein KSP40_PGU009455 [Platanthera guangdongensis]|uniref:Uncharacterized protein n=1 Tax=Platanthera guangdongensis TaxID=2320717 RepID=A0ABR2LFM5_9ASPA